MLFQAFPYFPDNQPEMYSTGFCRIFATGMFQTSSNCYDRAVLLWSRPIVLATTLPNKEGSGVLGLQRSVAKILQNPVYRQANCLNSISCACPVARSAL